MVEPYPTIVPFAGFSFSQMSSYAYVGYSIFYPVISYGVAGRVVLVWKNYGLYYRLGQVVITDHQFQWYNTGSIITNTDNNSRIAAIACKKGNSTFHLVWEQWYAEIRYSKLTLINNSTAIQLSDYAVISTGGGFPTVSDPSVTVIGSDYPSVVWIGTPYYNSNYKRVVQRTKGSYGWSSYFNYYDDVAKNPTISSTDDGNYNIPAWSTLDESTTKLAKYGNIKTFGVPGRYILLANAPNLNSMYGSAYKIQNLPYTFTTTSSVGSIAKESAVNANSGRAIIVTKDSAIFYFTLSDISLGDKHIGFTPFDEEFVISEDESINKYLMSEAFDVNDLSELTFNMQLGVFDSIYAKSLFVEKTFLKFRTVLIDENTGEVLGEYNQIPFDKSIFSRAQNSSFVLNLNNIKSRTVRLGIKMDTNLKALYTAANILDDENVLPKMHAQNITLNQEAIVTKYSLSQNYPNPFNPKTTIAYQIPEDGFVTLKVYDVLGNEVTTLINDYKTRGSYNVDFNGSDLASGVYLYRIKVNDYSATKKLILMK